MDNRTKIRNHDRRDFEGKQQPRPEASPNRGYPQNQCGKRLGFANY